MRPRATGLEEVGWIDGGGHHVGRSVLVGSEKDREQTDRRVNRLSSRVKEGLFPWSDGCEVAA